MSVVTLEVSGVGFKFQGFTADQVSDYNIYLEPDY